MPEQNVIDQLGELAAKESTGGGIIGKVKLETGVKIFVTGASNEDSFIVCDVRDADAKKKASNALKEKYASQFDPKKPPKAAFQTTIYQDSVKGRDVSSWQGNRVFCIPIWTDGFKKIVQPGLKNAGVDHLGEMWARIVFAKDPGGRIQKEKDGTPRTNPDGTPKVDDVAYVAEVYASERAALAAVAGGDVVAENKAASNSKVPDAWKDDPSSWTTWVIELRDALKGKPAPMIRKEIEKQFGKNEANATVEEIYQAVMAK